MGLPWDLHTVSMGFQQGFDVISIKFLWDVNEILMGFPWDFHIGFPWGFHEVFIGFHGIPMEYPWGFKRISMQFP